MRDDCQGNTPLSGSNAPERNLTAAGGLARAEGPLNQSLAAYREQSAHKRPEIAAAYDRLVTRLAAIDRDEVGPPIGGQMPEFLLPDHTGEIVALSSLLERGPLVVSFNRGHWCPYCQLELRALGAANEKIQSLGASVVSIMPETARFTKKSIEKNELSFPILSDIDLGYSISLGLIFWVGAEIKDLYQSIGIDLAQFQGTGGSFLPMAAKFIVGTDGLVKARAVNAEFRQRVEPEAIIAALEDLARAETK
jgi:peroxiredoxin